MILYILILLFIADRLTKWCAVYMLSHGPYIVNKILSFELAFNRGISWSLFHAHNSLIFILVSMSVCMVMAYLVYHMIGQMRLGRSITGELFVLVGGISNLIDRIMYGGVIDFIAFSYEMWAFPIFNIADCLVCFGVLIMGITMMRFNQSQSQKVSA